MPQEVDRKRDAIQFVPILKRTLLFSSLFAAMIITGSHASVLPPRLLSFAPAGGAELVRGHQAMAGEVLVKFEHPQPEAERTLLDGQLGADVDEEIGSLGVRRIHSTFFNSETLLRFFESRADVVYAEPNVIIHTEEVQTNPAFRPSGGLRNRRILRGDARAATGSGDLLPSTSSVIAVIDSGVDYTRPELANIWSAPSDFTVNIGTASISCSAGTHGFNAINRTCDPIDDNNHGTLVTGSLSASNANGLDWTGKIIAAKFLDSSGTGTAAGAIDAIEFAIQVRKAFSTSGAADIRVLASAWSTDHFSRSLLDEITNASFNNMLFVAAAGDGASNNDTAPRYPASFDAPNVIAVAATDDSDRRGLLSNYGAKSVHLGVPGTDILSTPIDGVQAFTGTSMAASLLSGAAARVLSSCDLDTAGLKNTLLGSVDPINSLGGVTVTGGRLNLEKAIQACRASGNGTSDPGRFLRETPSGRMTANATSSTTSTVINSMQACSNFSYPYGTPPSLTSVVFNESGVLRVFAPSSDGTKILSWYNDEHALTLGVRQVAVKTTTGTTTTSYTITPLSAGPGSALNPAVGTTALMGSQAGTDLATWNSTYGYIDHGRPLWPALFITDITTNPNDPSGDWQRGGPAAIPPTAVYGTWKSAVRSVDTTRQPSSITVTPDADPAKNNWSGLPDTPPGGFSVYSNEGYGAEIQWDATQLGLQAGHQYRLEFMIHHGGQNKSGGDGGEGCVTTSVTNVNAPAVQLTKAAKTNFSNPPKAGDTISYTFTVTNIGNVALTNIQFNASKVVLSNSLCGMSSPWASLAVQASTSCTALYTLSSADITAGQVANTAVVNGTPPSGAPVSSTASVNTPVIVQTITLNKTGLLSTTGAPTHVGDVINYSFQVTNTGNITLNNIAVTDPLAGLSAINCSGQTSLAAGAQMTCTASYKITQSDIDSGHVANNAKVCAGSLPCANDTENVVLNQLPALTLAKSGGPATYSSVGTQISYTYTVTNSGNVTVAGPFTVSDNKTTVTCPATTSLAPGASITCNATYAITQADLDSGSVTNTAAASGVFNGSPVTSPTASATVNAIQTPKISLAKVASPITYSTVGASITYTYTITNSGNITLAGPFSVTDDKQGTISPCGSGPLAPGASTSCTSTYAVTQADLDAGKITNIASVSGNNVTSLTATATVNAVQNPKLSLAKAGSPATYSAVGTVITYTYTVTNSGNVTIAGPFTISDNKTTVTCPVSNLIPGASLTCTATYSVTQADLDAGSVTNTAAASGNFNGSPVTSPTATATVNAIQTPTLSLAKPASPSTYTSVGAAITYTYTVTNSGNITLAGPFSVSGNKLGTIAPCGSGPLAPGASTSCTSMYTVTQADLDAGKITNIASVSGNNVTSPTATATVNAIQNPKLSLAKVASPGTYSTVGTVITYTYTVTNTGNITLAGPFSVTDDKLGTLSPCGSGPLAPGASTNCTGTYSITQADLDYGKEIGRAHV